MTIVAAQHLALDSLLESLGPRPGPDEFITGFTPPNRFAYKDFESYDPRHPTQAAALERMRLAAQRIQPVRGVRRWFAGRERGPRGLYLDGGFGVGKTHLLAALWNAAPEPRAYLSFDELVYYIGLTGPARAAASFDRYQLITVDEWELDDPGNLTLAVAFLRRVLSSGVRMAVTSNTLPLELGSGRFSQKDFRAEIEELASAFEVVRIEGEDYRHRNFEARPGLDCFSSPEALASAAARPIPDTLQVGFGELVDALRGLHPIRYRSASHRIGRLLLTDVQPIPNLPDSLRWVHFIDCVYDAGVPVMATGGVPLEELFPSSALDGPYAKKLSRCLSRMEELLGEVRVT